MKKILPLLCGLALFCLLTGCGQNKAASEGQALFSFDLDAPTEIFLLDGDLGYQFPITDPDEIQQLLELLDSYQYISSDDKIGVGWRYGISVTQGDVTTFIMLHSSETEEYIEYFTSPDRDGGESTRYLSGKVGTFSDVMEQIDALSAENSPEP